MKTIYIHIGTEKTGTTSIQEFLFVNHGNLLKYNFYYPINETKKYNMWKQHVPLVTSITKKNIPAYKDQQSYVKDEVFDEFIEDVRKIKQDNIIISSEGFSLIESIDKIHSLKKKLEEFKIKIIIYIRRQDEFLISKLQQSYKTGRYFPFEVDELLSFCKVNYYQIISNWSHIFGRKNIIIRIFEKGKLYNNDLYADFLNVLDLDLNSDFIKTLYLNKSVSLKKTLFLHRLSEYFTPIDMKNNLKKFDHLEIRNIIIQSNILNEGNIKDIFSYEDRKYIMSYYETENQKILSEFFGQDKTHLFNKLRDSNYSSDKKEIMSDSEFIKGLIETTEVLFEKSKLKDAIFYKLMRLLSKNKLTEERIDFEYKYIIDNNLFDKAFYLSEYEDVLLAKIDPLIHYIKFGWYEGRFPNKHFDTHTFIIDNIELLDKDINPLVYYHIHKLK